MVDGIYEALHRRMANIDNWVSKREYLVGEGFTLADLTLASVLGHGYAKLMDKAWRDQYPEAFGYFQRIIKDPKVKGTFGEPTLIDKTPEHKPKEA